MRTSVLSCRFVSRQHERQGADEQTSYCADDGRGQPKFEDSEPRRRCVRVEADDQPGDSAGRAGTDCANRREPCGQRHGLEMGRESVHWWPPKSEQRNRARVWSLRILRR